jgi:hypothetical protein
LGSIPVDATLLGGSVSASLLLCTGPAIVSATVGLHIVAGVALFSAVFAAALAFFGEGRRHHRQRGRSSGKHPLRHGKTPSNAFKRAKKDAVPPFMWR